MSPVDVHVVAGRMFFVEFHVADQGGAGMTCFQQIVAEHGVLGEASLHGPLERIHVVDSFSDERAFPKDILIHVGHFPRVGIDARITGEKSHEPGTSGARQAHADSRLQDAVAFVDNLARGIEHRAVQRMGHRAHELPGSLTRELGVGVERDDILDRRENGGVADDLGEAFAGASAQQRVELGEFSPLALVAHPQPFAGVPAAWPVKQKEEIMVCSGILRIQHLDSGPRPLLQHVVSRQHRLGGIAEIRQQREVKVMVPVGEMMDLQCLD